MKICSFHPNLLFCDTSNWENDEKHRDIFVETLINNLDIIKKLDIKQGWTDELESKFWNNPPWRKDELYKYLLVEIFFDFQSTKMFLFSPPETKCDINQKIEINNNIEKIKDLWLILLHRLMHRYDEVYLVSNNSEDKPDLNLKCTCNQDNKNLFFPIINNPKKWYSFFDFLDFWPISKDIFNERFRLVIDACFYKELQNSECKVKQNDYECEMGFIKDIMSIKTKNEKRQLVRGVTKRITLKRQEAAKDSGLQEEKIGKNFYRFRTSEGSRVHHKIKNEKIIFLRYFPSSKHDRGLLTSKK
jgi:hypothetical protein